jgi:hypothetical protein
MPQIPQYQQRVSANQPLRLAPVDPNDVNAPLQGARQVVGATRALVQDVEHVRDLDRQQAEQKAAVWANEQSMSSRSQWTTRLPELMDAAPEDGTGFAKQALEEFDKSSADLVQAAPTTASRDWIKQNLSQQRLAIQGQAQEFERKRGIEFKLSGTERAVDGARIAAEARPEDFEQIVSSNDIAIQAAGFTPKIAADLREKSARALSGAAVTGMIRKDPYSALKELETEDSKSAPVRGLTFEQRLTLRNSAEAEINRRESEAKSSKVEARQAMSDKLRDIQVAATNGMTITDIPSLPELKFLYGESEGTQRYQQTVALAAMSPKMAAMYQAPANEILTSVQSFKPTQVDGAADQFAMYGVAQQKGAAILREREADPGGYLTQHSTSVGEAWKALQSADPDDTEAAAKNYLRSVRAEKERLGITSQDVLPDSYASAVVDSITRPQNAESMANRMASEAQRWGSAWPDVYKQVQKKLPDAALVIGSGIPKRAADTLALMSSKSPDELKTLVPAGHTMNDLEKDVTEELADLTSTFGPEGATTLNAVRNSTVKTAVGYMASGASYKDAIAKAAADLANDKYTYQNFRDQTYRVPAEFDGELIDDGASYFLQNYAQAPGTVQVPPGTPEASILAQASDAIRRGGYWRTAPDESGLRLYVNTGVVPGPNGKPVQLSWAELQKLSQQASASQAVRSQDVRQLQEENIR